MNSSNDLLTLADPDNAAPTITLDPARATIPAIDNGPLVNPFGGLSFWDDEKDVLTVTISFDTNAGKLEIPEGIQATSFTDEGGWKVYTFTGRADALAIIMDVLQFDAAERDLGEANSHVVTPITIGVIDEDHDTPAEAVVEIDTLIANRAPTNITLSNLSVSEIVGGAVGILTAADQEGASFTYRLTNNAGGRISLVTTTGESGETITKVVATSGLLLDYEQAKAYVIRVEVSDGKGGVFEKDLRIDVANVASENIAGSAGNDVFVGGTGRDTIRGNAGNDKLNGGAGNDTLYGNAGRDTFVFNTKPNKSSNKDKILDWKAKDDTIQLENAIFKALKKTGTLKKDSFVLNAVAKDSNDFVGYNKKNGDLWYDPNGNKSGGQVVFANIGLKKTIAYNDFHII